MPRRMRKHGPGTPSVRVPKRCAVEHEYVCCGPFDRKDHIKIPVEYDEKGKKAVKWLSRSFCANCSAKAVLTLTLTLIITLTSP